jgi:hypothetical protein
MATVDLEIDCGELGRLVLTYALDGLRWEAPQTDCGYRGGWEADAVRLSDAWLDGVRLPKGALLLHPFAPHLPRWEADAWQEWLIEAGEGPGALYDDSDAPHWSEVA